MKYTVYQCDTCKQTQKATKRRPMSMGRVTTHYVTNVPKERYTDFPFDWHICRNGKNPGYLHFCSQDCYDAYFEIVEHREDLEYLRWTYEYDMAHKRGSESE